MKFNKFNLKNYYQNKNRSKKVMLVKINEKSESENDSFKKIHTMNNKKLLNKNNSNHALDHIDSNCFNSDLLENSNSSNLEKDNLKNNLRKMENNNSRVVSSNFLSKNENIFKENIYYKNRKEITCNDSDNRDIIRLKNLNTNDTTSLQSSEDSISKTNSFQLDYNSVNFFSYLT